MIGANLWGAIGYVSSGLTLSAFLAAVGAWIYKHKSEEKERLIKAAPESERAALVESALEFFRVDTSRLTKEQGYQIALTQIKARTDRLRIAALIVVALAILAAAVSAYAIFKAPYSQSDPGRATLRDPGFEVVDVDLAGHAFDRALPVDRPFILSGVAPQGAVALEVRCWAFPAAGAQQELIAQEMQRTPDGNCWDGGQLVWRNTIDPGAPPPKFRLPVPRLAADRSYRFKFSLESKITGQEAKVFAQNAQRALDVALWGSSQEAQSLPQAGDLTLAEMESLRSQLIRELQKAARADFFLEPSSIFNQRTPLGTVREELGSQLLPLLNVQREIRAAVEDYDREVADLNVQLELIRRESSLSRLRDVLARYAKTQPSVLPQAEEVAAVFSLGPAPVLLQTDLQSAAALSGFLKKRTGYFSSAAADLDRLRVFLESRLMSGSDSPQPFLVPLVAGGQLSKHDLVNLVSLAEPRGLIGSADRSLRRVEGLLARRLQDSLSGREQALAAIAGHYGQQVESMACLVDSTVTTLQPRTASARRSPPSWAALGTAATSSGS